MTPPVAVVTGATGTLGRQVVATLAAEGLLVVAVRRSGATTGSGEASTVAADLGDDSCIAGIREATPAGRLAMVVHSVGLPGAPDVSSVEPSLLARAVDIKAGGLLRLMRALDDRIEPGTRVVAVGGHMGDEPTEHAPLAGVANAALANLVRQLAGPLGRRQASVHLIAPGPFESDRVDTMVARKAVALGLDESTVRDELLADVPQGRLPTADDVAWAIGMLLAPSASAMNGSTLFLDGGSRRGIF